jgi:hypothetical protein
MNAAVAWKEAWQSPCCLGLMVQAHPLRDPSIVGAHRQQRILQAARGMRGNAGPFPKDLATRALLASAAVLLFLAVIAAVLAIAG